MKSNDMDDGIDVSSAEVSRAGDARQHEPVALETDSLRTPTLYERLRPGYGAPRSNPDRWLSGGFVVAGVLCLAAGLAVETGQQILFALAGIGLFAGVLTYGLSAEGVIDARDGERVYGTCADNLKAIAAALGSADDRIYVPDPDASDAGVLLLVPTAPEERFRETTDGSIDDPRGRGLLLEPTGSELYGEFEDALTEPVAGSPEPLAEQLTDALRHRFEFVTDADPVVRGGERQATVAVSGAAFGPVDRFDHPVASFLAVGFAAGLDREISLEVSPATDSGVWLVSCRWGTETDSR